MEFVLFFLPAGLALLANRLIRRDANTTGADDAFGRIILEVSPAIPELIEGKTPNENTTDKVMTAIYTVAKRYLADRGKLPESGE